MKAFETAERSRGARRRARPRRSAAALLGLWGLTLVSAATTGRALRAEEGAGSPAEEPTLEAFMQGMASAPGVAARFHEVKELGLLSQPLESRGTLHFVPPDRLARVTTEPSRSRLVIDGERFAFHDEAGGETADLASSPMAREFVNSFIVLFNGDLEALRERYAPRFAVDGERWSLVLQPLRSPLADVVEAIRLEGSGRVLERIELRETDGDRTVTTFDAVEVDRRFEDAELERIFGIPERSAGGS